MGTYGDLSRKYNGNIQIPTGASFFHRIGWKSYG